MMPEEYADVVELIEEPAMPVVQPWAWDTTKLAFAALGVLGVGFIVWFLMSYTTAKAAAIASESNE